MRSNGIIELRLDLVRGVDATNKKYKQTTVTPPQIAFQLLL